MATWPLVGKWPEACSFRRMTLVDLPNDEAVSASFSARALQVPAFEPDHQLSQREINERTVENGKLGSILLDIGVGCCFSVLLFLVLDGHSERLRQLAVFAQRCSHEESRRLDGEGRLDRQLVIGVIGPDIKVLEDLRWSDNA